MKGERGARNDSGGAGWVKGMCAVDNGSKEVGGVGCEEEGDRERSVPLGSFFIVVVLILR